MKIGKKIQSLLTKALKYKYTVLILLLGIGLMLWPQGDRKQAQPIEQEVTEISNGTDNLEEKLRRVLQQMYGVGNVEVLLTLETGTSYQYQSDVQTRVKGEESEVEKETVFMSNGNGKEVPVTVKTIYPTYQGALILCQGADSAAVRLNIVNAVSNLTGLGSDKISVIKMKGN